jgi:hypothetical protein
MQNLIELFEMVSMNDAALRGSEKKAIRQARLALGMFAKAMESFKMDSAEESAAAEAPIAIAA